MIIGFLTRPIAVLLVIEFAVIVYHHIPNGYAWIVRGSEYPLFWGGALRRHRYSRGRTLLSRSGDRPRSLIDAKKWLASAGRSGGTSGKRR
jgi:hypothetical protein